ncbi:hypothetical protein [Caldalkalibacillus salinus]|uniref:hypothetical protein n=1 Tax=Caldalkalibacillus salinus TaxID=2803787 RepID=UPI001924E35A|nr:hypothetical protein [Caldalkalibacillus salinus]
MATSIPTMRVDGVICDIHAQLHGKESLGAISDGLLDEDFQVELGLDSISASQLSRKNNEVDTSLLAKLFLEVLDPFEVMEDKYEDIKKELANSRSLTLPYLTGLWSIHSFVLRIHEVEVGYAPMLGHLPVWNI